MISIIIPILNEERALPALLSNLAALQGDFELIIADGGSTDNSLKLAKPYAKLVVGATGRAAQCNAAAGHAQGDTLLFLHADSQLAPDALIQVEQALTQGAKWGCFKLRFDDTHILMRLGAAKSNFRARRQGIVFGDQGIFISRPFFTHVGCFPALPIMEDYQFSLNLKSLGIRPWLLDSFITTSARRFQQGGRLRMGLRMHRLRYLYRQGIPAEQLLNIYREVRL